MQSQSKIVRSDLEQQWKHRPGMGEMLEEHRGTHI